MILHEIYLQAMEQQQKDNPTAGGGQDEPEVPKAKRPAEAASAEGQVTNHTFDSLHSCHLVSPWTSIS